MLWNMLDGPSVEKDEIENFGAFINIFFPLSLARVQRGGLAERAGHWWLLLESWRLLLLGGQVIKQVCEALVLDVAGFWLKQTFYVF